MTHKTSLILAALSVLATPLAAQPEMQCETSRNGNDRQARFCEIREYPQPASSRVLVDGRTNGGISVKGWDRSDMLVRAKVQAWAPAESEAQALSRQISVQSAGGNIRADAPEFGRDRGWAVSYEVFVPRTTDLSLKAHNGGISIADVRGTLDFEAVNGGVSLKRLAGSVQGKTTNGALKVELTGNRWDGRQMDISATNGGISIAVPGNYSARLEARTVNGRVAADLPGTPASTNGRELSVNLGSGGPLIRATTTNGGISVKRTS